MRSSSSLPFRRFTCLLVSGHPDENATRGVVEERSADRTLPPACGERGVLVVPDHDQVGADRLRPPADLLDRLAHREMPGGIEAAVAQRADALVEHGLCALLL